LLTAQTDIIISAIQGDHKKTFTKQTFLEYKTTIKILLNIDFVRF